MINVLGPVYLSVSTVASGKPMPVLAERITRPHTPVDGVRVFGPNQFGAFFSDAEWAMLVHEKGELKNHQYSDYRPCVVYPTATFRYVPERIN
jgi:hypothetical protein